LFLEAVVKLKSTLKYIAWIPARGNSKRLPKKNIINFCGHPLIYYSIDIAQRSGNIDKVIVSSDDEQILQISHGFRSATIKRPAELAGDNTTVGATARHLLESFKTDELKNLRGLITLQPTQPLRSLQQIADAINQFEKHYKTYDSALSVCINRKKIGTIVNNTFKTLTYKPEQKSQELTTTYFENGSIYISKPEFILNHERVFSEDSLPIIQDDIYGMVDVDTHGDLKLGEVIFNQYKALFLKNE